MGRTGKTWLLFQVISTKLLSREIATLLHGRSISTEIFPFNFAEVLQHEGIANEY